jgi:hypothetical protein
VRPAQELLGGHEARARREAGEDPFGSRQTSGAGDRLVVVDREEPVDQPLVQERELRHRVSPSLDPMSGAGDDLVPQRPRTRRLDDVAADRRVAGFQEPSHARERPTRADELAERVHPAPRLLPELRRRALLVRRAVPR